MWKTPFSFPFLVGEGGEARAIERRRFPRHFLAFARKEPPPAIDAVEKYTKTPRVIRAVRAFGHTRADGLMRSPNLGAVAARKQLHSVPWWPENGKERLESPRSVDGERDGAERTRLDLFPTGAYARYAAALLNYEKIIEISQLQLRRGSCQKYLA